MTALPVRDFQLLLPPGWVRVPIDDRVAERVVTVASILTRDVPPDHRETARRALVHVLQLAVADAENAGGTDLVLSVGSVGGIALAASCVVTFLPRHTPELEALVDELRDSGGDVSIVTVASSTAVRRRTRSELEHDPAVVAEVAGDMGVGRPPDAPPPVTVTDQVTYFVPVPGGDDLLVFTFGTTQPELGEALVTLFDAIMSTMRWVA